MAGVTHAEKFPEAKARCWKIPALHVSITDSLGPGQLWSLGIPVPLSTAQRGCDPAGNPRGNSELWNWRRKREEGVPAHAVPGFGAIPFQQWCGGLLKSWDLAVVGADISTRAAALNIHEPLSFAPAQKSTSACSFPAKPILS